MMIHSRPRRAVAVLGALLTGLLLVLTGCATGGDGKGRPDGPRSPGGSVAGTRSPGGSAESAVPDRAAGMPVVAVGELPAQARDTLRHIDAGGPFPYPKDGAVFGNHERLLPPQPRGYYHEYTVRTPGSRDRGARRLITGDRHETYYTDDHYRTFKAVLR
ncbi:ribonuclease domain-containing protein [Streptomyces halobius]|uniref:Guanine-specific ribonuclease N1 and T1 n=1 Tax=Streptomyces halobius TaxID=2879846 RepID=A0ABY4MJP5_9ACTN|nr:ribonuclease domain-containing protein [Streptomyces halobius]UQA96541.1 guanine-specific ribonuclease N1 and T1 [Streptomyces halobius]